MTYSEIFEINCPIYMAYGMTYEEYWFSAPGRAKAYREAYKLKVKAKEAEMWRQGLYILDALNVSIYNNLNFSGKHRTPQKYIEKPLEVVAKSKAEQRIEAEQERQKAVESLKAWGNALRRKYNGDRDIRPRIEN